MRLFRRTTKMDRGEVIPWYNVWVLDEGDQTILKPARANKAVMGNNITLKSQKGHGISKYYTME